MYALGCVLYHALTGRPPFVGDSALAVGAGATDTMPLPIDTMSEEVIDPSPLAARARSGARRWEIAAAAAAGVVLIGLVLAGLADGDDPERPAGADDDPPITTTVPTTDAAPDEEKGEDGKDEDDGKGNGEGKGKKGDD